MGAAGLVAEGVHHRYGWRAPEVLSGLDWHVPVGSRTVLLGPNGAGKSTLLGVLSQVLRPRRGRVTLIDSSGRSRPAGDRQARRRIAWMPQRVVAVPGLTTREQAAYAGWLKGMSRRDAWDRAGDALSRVGLTDHAGKKASRLSGGQLRRLGLAEALAHDAQFLLLDEPTAGLDPAQREGFRRVLNSLPPEVTVVVSTHQVDDLTELFNAVAVLADGCWRFEGTPSQFLAIAGPAVHAGRAAEIAYGSLVGADA